MLLPGSRPFGTLAIMREDLIYDQEQQRQYDRQVHGEKVAWKKDKRGVFRLPKEKRVKIGNTGMQKRLTIPKNYWEEHMKE